MDLPFSRRQLLKTMGTGLGSLGLAAVLRDQGAFADTRPASPLGPKPTHFAPRAKSIIHLFMNGGPSQVDSFDHKPALTRYQGQRPPAANLSTERKTGNLMPSPFTFRKYGQSGLEISSLFPHVAQCADDLCVIRSMVTDIPNHEPALLMMTCGNNQPIRPSLGAWLLYGLGTENQNLPGFVTLCPGRPGVIGPQLWGSSFLPGIFQGCHVNHRGLNPRTVIADINNTHLSRNAQREQLDLVRLLNEQHLAQRAGDNVLEARIQSMEMAFRMQFEAQDVFDIAQETRATRDLYGPGDFANGCLLARRLVERGVRVVQLYFGANENWDSHGDIMHHATCARQVDQPIAALLKDLKSRGLLEDTIVLWGGEFGRTPTSEGNTGRDHNHFGFSVWLAGGGVRGGLAYGATDEFGFTAMENRMHVHDLHATLLHLMGLDHEKLTFRYSGRDFRLTDVEGRVPEAILA